MAACHVSHAHESPLFEDEHCSIYEDHIVIKSYFFPVGHKTVRFNTIHSINTHEQLGLSPIQMKEWGMGLSNIWWALDWDRAGIQLTGPSPELELIIIKVEHDVIRKGFSVSRKSDALALLRKLVPGAFEKGSHELIQLTAGTSTKRD
ncbi:hypothetical protein M427DRAFT_144538 [Gonapodya prolifera JEL478]|uniref:Uncharacterized protein n=1 Tax=Gonapodya prolifera (strain JEL478) TaxID=1344416 RepID=A0A139AJV2_GONPJ|nr:hypothetical protein M427DRAFT_144538 [Gonapodya prolifera JEL478]|eukprot:KXS16988.1 hypothetical protein M427DRAFT_144538 [Gonapodya prolifera JEL478]